MTTWQKENPTQSDKWYLLVNVWDDILCDNSWNRIVLHNWSFYDSDTQWIKEI